MTVIIFDLDGTLIDSVPDLHGAAVRLLEGENKPALDPATIRSFVGNGVPMLVQRIMAASGIDDCHHARLLELFLTHYQSHPCDKTTLYPGVRDSLDRLKSEGHTLGICTNKPAAPTHAILDALGLSPMFAVVIGGDTLAVRKPDPAPLAAAFAPLGLGPRLFVGDSEVDAETALAHGTTFALYTEGYRKAPAHDIPHDILFSNYADLSGLATQFLDKISA